MCETMHLYLDTNNVFVKLYNLSVDISNDFDYHSGMVLIVTRNIN